MSEKSAIEELAELEAQEAAEAAAEAAAKASRAEEEARIELANRKAIREMKARHPGVELRRIDTVAGMAIVKAPTTEQFDRFHRLCLDEATRPDANKVLASVGTIHPAPEVLEEWFKARPALINSLAARIVEVAGSDTTAKKL